MPTPDPNNVLFKIAHPDLYERNPFNVLNLPVDATAKDIRRRKEDLEAAFDAGTEAAEFANILPGDEARKTPTRAEVDELFATLEDPEKRIAYALFWFWQEPHAAKPRNPNRSIAEFLSMFEGNLEEAMRADGIPTPLLGRHNLAVFHHMRAMAAEKSLLGEAMQSAVDPAVENQLSSHWKSAIAGWNALANDPDAWHAVSDLVAALDDPRVDYRFARALRDQFAFAFDQINVELAIDFAKTGHGADAKRQVEYMKLSQPDSDDVEGTFDDAFAGLLRQTEAVVNSAREETQKNPKKGLKKANDILTQTEEPLRVSRVVFEKGTPIRNSIVTTVFVGVRSCLIAYGNATRDWLNCLALTRKLNLLAESERHTNQIIEDERIIQKNIRENADKRGIGNKLANQSNNQSQQAKSSGNSSGNKVIELFHEWCKHSEKVFPLVSDMSRDQQISIAQSLFQALSKDANNHKDVYALLQLLQKDDKESVEGDRHVTFSVGATGRTFGCHLPASPNRDVYLAGYNFLSMIHFQQYPYHNISVANRLLLEALKKEKLGLCSVYSEGRWSEGYQTYNDKTVIHIYVRKRSYWGLCKTYSELSVVIRIEALVPKSKTDLISIEIVQPDDQRKAWKEAPSVAKRVNDQFRLRGFNLSWIREKDANEGIHCLSSLVQQLLSDLTDCIREQECDVAGTEWPNDPRAWKWVETIPVL